MVHLTRWMSGGTGDDVDDLLRLCDGGDDGDAWWGFVKLTKRSLEG